MGVVTPLRRNTDVIIRMFFQSEMVDVKGKRYRRLERAEADLRRCFEAHADRVLTDPERYLLTIEQQFDPEGAAARVADVDAVLQVLPMYLEDPEWFGDDLEDRRLRILMAKRLARQVPYLKELQGRSVSEPVLLVRVAAHRAGRRLDRDRMVAKLGAEKVAELEAGIQRVLERIRRPV